MLPNGARLTLRIGDAIASSVSQAISGGPATAEITLRTRRLVTLEVIGRRRGLDRPVASNDTTFARISDESAETVMRQMGACVVAKSKGL